MYHRIAFQEHEKPRIIQMGTRQFICGVVALAVAMDGAVPLVTDVLFRKPAVIAVVACVTAMFCWLWFGIGLWRRWHG